MSKPPSLKSRKRPKGTYYYCVFRGKQHGLGYDYTEARIAFARLIGDLPPATSDSVSLGELAAWFDDWSRMHSSEATAKDYRYWLSRFVVFVGPEIPAMDLKPAHVESFAVDRRHVNDWSHHKIVRAVKRLYRWAKEQRHLEFQQSPIHGLKLPPAPDSPEVVFSPLQVWFCWRSSSIDFRPALRWYYHTGCRPEEMPVIKCSWVDVEKRVVTIPKPKAKGKKRVRHIPYPSKLDKMVRRCLRRSQSGHLFENSKGKPFTRWAVDTRHDRIEDKQPSLFPDGCYARIWRYTFATRMIKRGMDIVTLSHVMGHKDLRMLRQHYEKLGTDFKHLTGELDRLSRGKR